MSTFFIQFFYCILLSFPEVYSQKIGISISPLNITIYRVTQYQFTSETQDPDA